MHTEQSSQYCQTWPERFSEYTTCFEIPEQIFDHGDRVESLHSTNGSTEAGVQEQELSTCDGAGQGKSRRIQ